MNRRCQSKWRAVRGSTPDGFTRLDLIALVAAMMLVMLLLFPASGDGRLRAGVIACLNKQKQLAAAWHAYAEDRSGRVIGFGDAGPEDWRVRPGMAYFNANPPPAVPAPQSAREAVIRFDSWGYQLGGLYAYAPDTNLIHCPDARAILDRTQPGPAYTSYSGIDGFARFTSSTRIRNFSELLHPDSRFLWVEEADPRPTTFGGFSFRENIGTWGIRSGGVPDPSIDETYGVYTFWDGPAAFHGDGATFSYADGHAYYRRWMDVDTIRFANNPVWGRLQGTGGALRMTNDLKFIVRGFPSRLNP